MSRLTGVFVGDSTLLLHCAELFERAGHSVAHICSRHPQVTIWANERGIPITRPVMGDRNSLELPLLQVSYDYLFSVANLQALSTAVISRAKILALNFHDGPLPRYAGLNAPQWALLAGERQHGITWHEMTIRPDTGRIAIQVQIAIDPDETVLSLNAKCYAAGASSFATLLSMAQGRTPMLTPQNGERTYFAKSHRPAQAGVIDVASSVKNVVRLVRALDCGSFWSPIANAKLTFGDTAISVRGAEPIEAPPGSEPGTIIASSTATIDVVLPDGGVRLHGLETLAGEPLEPDTLVAFEPGRRVQSLTLQQVKRIDEVAAASARSEPYWLSCIAQASALELSYPLVKAAFHSRASSLWHTRTLSASTMQLASSIGTTAAAALLAVQAAWLARLGAATHPHIAYADPGTVSAVAGVEAIFSPYRPAILAVTLDQSLRALADCAELEISGSKRHGPLAHDLIGRLARTNSPVSGQPLPNVALIVCGSSPGEIPPTSASHVLLMDAASGHITLSVSATHYSSEVADAMAAHFDHALTIACTMPDVPIGDLSLVPPAEALIFAAIDQAARYDFTTVTVDRAFAAQVRRTPERIAVRDRDNELSYRDLDTRVAAIAEALGAKNVGRGAIVGVSLERSTDMVATLIAIMRLGAAYVPIDPRFPLLRRRMIERDSRAHLIVIDRAQDCPDTPDRTITLRVDLIATKPLSSRLSELESSHSSSDLAYLMYTSGSTGVPKGVAVSHANVANFFAGMDQRIPASDRDGVWLAVTSISFDISVLELLWTITRGYTVALYDPNETPAKTGPSFSLFYFSAAADQNADTENGGTYRLLLEGSRFADANGFEAVWTPERHFHNFGGLYPNPAITGAAVAAITKNVSIRAGSCVLPLHDPIQIAEDWSVLDNLSNGRTGVAIASGWMPEDFVLQPEVFVNRHKTMLNHIDTIEKLWRGAVIERRKPSGELVPIRTMPRPIQPRLPMWLTAARNPETFRLAGERGFNVLTHLIGMTRAELAANIKHYHASRTKAGHSGRGRITLMLHTFVGTDEQAVRELVRAPMKRYLASSVELVRAAAWTFPTFVAQNSAGANGSDAFDLGGLSEAELDTVLEHAFSRYYEANGLFGSVQTCMQTAQDLIAIGVDEFACLIDFGVDTTIVLENLPHLKALMDQAQKTMPPASLAAGIKTNCTTHFQCSPSLVAMLLADEEGREALSVLDALFVGGEALSSDMMQALVANARGRVFNMYGPTETTIWSTTAELSAADTFVPLGKPIANTTLRVVDKTGADCPALISGELLIGGAGVARGYWHRLDQTAERFVEPVPASDGERYFRTGDLVRRHPDGRIEFLGRIDQQIKIRGHRIELGEIEAALAADASVSQAVVVAVDDGFGGLVTAAFVTAAAGQKPDSNALRLSLEQTLPAIMIPQSITILDKFQLTPNGKIDRKALAVPPRSPAEADTTTATPQSAIAASTNMPEQDRGTAPPIASPSGIEIEQRITHLWRQLLRVETVSRTVNFFELGGHSLLAVQMHRALSLEIAPSLSLIDVFRYPTIDALTKRLIMLTSFSGDRPIAASSAVSDGSRRAASRLAASSRLRPPSGERV